MANASQKTQTKRWTTQGRTDDAIDVRVQASEPQAPPQMLHGHLDAITDGYAEGWVFDSLHPERRLNVEILNGERVVARGTADQFREDLKKAGIGDGCYKFSLRLSYELFDGQPHHLTARVTNTARQLDGGAKIFEATATTPGDLDLMGRAATLQLAKILAQRSVEPAKARTFLAAVEDANLAMEMHEFDDALRRFQEIQDKYDVQALVQCKLGETYMLAQRFEEAASAFHRATQILGNHAWAFLSLGNAYRKLGAWSDAEDAYRAALAIEPNAALFKQRLAEVTPHALPERCERLIAEGKFEEAIKTARHALITGSNQVEMARLLKKALAAKDNRPFEDEETRPEHIASFELELLALEAVLDTVEQTLDSRV